MKKLTKPTKKPTTRDKALAKIKEAKLNLQDARKSASLVARDASEKRKVAKKAATEQERADGLIYGRENQLGRAMNALEKLDQKLAAAEEAKLAKVAAKAAAKAAAKTPEPEAESEADDMGDDDAVGEKPEAEDDMGADDDESVEA